MGKIAPTERFSNRVGDDARHRPRYPPAVVATLAAEAGLGPGSTVADVGSGTGISSELFLRRGCAVAAVEPNREKRRAAEGFLASFPRFLSIAGSAEATTLPDGSVDFVVAAQAFHWFDRDKARAEFARILKPGGRVVLLWNSRRLDATPFLIDYEALLQRFGTDYRAVHESYLDEGAVRRFFAPAPCERRAFPNEQAVDFEGLRGRLLSSSYVPAPDQPSARPMLEELARLFARHQDGDRVSFLYTTELYFGRLAG
jgi:SAM-dependent methyltransferase